MIWREKLKLDVSAVPSGFPQSSSETVFSLARETMSETPEASPAFKSTPVGEIKLTDSTAVKISTFDGRDGRKRVDIRLFLSGEKYTGPTKKGVSLPLENLPELLRLLQSVK